MVFLRFLCDPVFMSRIVINSYRKPILCFSLTGGFLNRGRGSARSILEELAIASKKTWKRLV
jgi:hypothetical protein